MMKAPGTVILRNSLINKLGTFNGFSKRKILYFATCFCFVLALLLLALFFFFHFLSLSLLIFLLEFLMPSKLLTERF